MNTETLLSQANEFEQKIIEYRRFLHMHPETGFDLKITKEYVKNELIQMGYEPQECGKCGLIVLVGGRKPGKTFMLRADMDALQIQEQADVEFKSLHEGKMHACGHDMHTAMLLGAARLLKQHEDEIEGTIKLCFQPSEETFEGSKDMIEHGSLKKPDVDAALMIHVMAGMPMQAGSVIVCDGGVSAPAADYFRIKIQGKGCHGAMPQVGIDPITIAAHIITALQELHARELAMMDEAALTFGIMQAGQAENVTSYCKELLGTSRAFSTAQLKAMSPNASSSKTVGSEDFAYVSQEVPSIMLALAAGEPQNGYCYPQHHPMVKFDEAVLAPGSCVYAYTAMRWLEEHK